MLNNAREKLAGGHNRAHPQTHVTNSRRFLVLLVPPDTASCQASVNLSGLLQILSSKGLGVMNPSIPGYEHLFGTKRHVDGNREITKVWTSMPTSYR